MQHEPRPRRGVGRLIVAVAAAALAAAGLVGLALPANAAPAAGAKVNPYSPAYQHPYRHGVVPTREVSAQMKAHPSSIAGPNDLNYGGGVDGIGVTTGKPKIYLVFWGSQWGTAGTDANGNTTFSGDINGEAPRLQQLFKGLGNGGELWSGVMTQFCEGVAAGSQTCPASAPHVGYPTGGALAGVWANTGAASPTAPTAAQLGQTAVSAASHFGNTTPASNRNAQYAILSAHNIRPDGFPSAGFCAWHDWNGDVGVGSTVGDIAFTNMPYVTDAGTSCGVNFINAGSAGTLDGVTIVEGHEYSETITDQNPAGGWTDSTGFENADKCAWVTTGPGRSQNVAFTTGTFAMQGTWGNDTSGCQISHAIVGGGTGAVTVTNPGSQTGTVGVATSLTLTASGGTPPYTWSATGLPTGLSINASTGVVSGTPTTATTFTVTATARDTASATGSTTFTWTIRTAGGGCSGQLLGNPGFESGAAAAPWSATAGVIDSSAGQPSHSGTWKAWLNGYGTTHTDTLSQSVSIPAGCHATLTFWLHIDSAETTTTTQFDKLTVKVGATTVATFSNLNKAAGYTLRTFDASAAAGSTVSVLFTGTEDSSLQTSFVVDDTALTLS